MVFLTFRLLGRKSKPDKFWKRKMIRRLTWVCAALSVFDVLWTQDRHFFGRKRNCFKLSLPFLRRALRYSTRSRKLQSTVTLNLHETRIAAGCAEHGVQFSPFLSTLQQMNIELNRKVLSEFAIYEPRTFQSLCELVKRHHAGLFQKNLKPSNRIFTKGML